jgi:hypothetical protein
MQSPTIRYLNRNFDDFAILTFLAHLAFDPTFEITEENQAILSALRRSSEQFKYADINEIRSILNEYSEDQLHGLVSNVKGIAHEMEFVHIENSDGDGIYASLYPDTNHASYDIQLFDKTSGHHWPVQLKATDSASYVDQWQEQHPEGHILVTDELADELGLESSGMENGELTADTEEFVDKLIEFDDEGSLSELFPALTVASSALVILELWQRYQSGQISYSKFKTLALLSAGKKGIKIGALIAVMSIPGVNVAVGALMLAQLIHSTTTFAAGRLDKLHFHRATNAIAHEN